MIKKVIESIFGSLEKDVEKVMEIEKSIKDNKEKAIELSQEFNPIIKKLERDFNIMSHYCNIKKGEERDEGLVTLNRTNDKLKKAKSEYFKELSELRKSNAKLNDKLQDLLSKDQVKELVEKAKKKDSIDKIIKSLNEGVLDYDKLKKAHKYIRREGSPGNYKYIYKESEEKGDKKEEISKEQREKNFKEWFGDSKVVDENGKPKVVYHGTNSDFSEFNNKGGNIQSYAVEGHTYFSSNPDIAETYIKSPEDKEFKGSVLPVYLKIENPLEIDFNKKRFNNPTAIDDKLYKDILVTLGFKGEKYFERFPNDRSQLVGLPMIEAYAKKKGHDGVIAKNVVDLGGEVENEVATTYVTFSPNQIKSAIGNKGAFDSKSNDITKSETRPQTDTKEFLEEMIKEHERLIGILKPHAEMDEKVKKELSIQEKELKEYKDELEDLKEKGNSEYEKIQKSIEKIEDLFNKGIIPEDILIKARTGKYADNPVNRRLNRVGQPYGSKKQEDESKQPKTGKKEDEKKDGEPQNLEEQAKQTSGSALEQAAKEANDPEVRSTAHKELDRREKEEKVQEEESGDKPTKTDEKKDNDGKNQQEEGVKEEPSAKYSSEKNKLKKALLDKEKELINKTNNEYESLSFLNKDGEEILNIDREKGRVTIPDDKVPDIINAEVATHNHPSSKGFSIADIAVSLSKNIKEMRAIAPNSMLGDWFSLSKSFESPCSRPMAWTIGPIRSSRCCVAAASPVS